MAEAKQTASSASNFRRLTPVKRGAALTLLIIALQCGIAYWRFANLQRGGDEQFKRELYIPNYPRDWVSRKARARMDIMTNPRNTLVRIAYASVLMDEHRLHDAEQELRLASFDSNAIAALLPGSSRLVLFAMLAEVLVKEDKGDEADAVLAKACGRQVHRVNDVDFHLPCA